jgi:hypothetical protein
MKMSMPILIAILSLLVSVPFFFVILNAPLSAMLKFVLAVAVLAGCGYTIGKAFRFESYAGLFLLRSQRGLGLLDRLAAKYPAAWEQFAQIGMVVGYGSFAYFLMGNKRLGWKKTLFTYGIGVFLLVLISAIIPVAMSTLLSMVSGGAEFANAGSKLQAQNAQFEYMKYISLAMMVLGGVSLMATASVVMYAGVVAGAIGGALMGNAAHLQQTSPGGMPILPGVNLDLIQGLLALSVVLAVHEGMHGILARIYGMPLKSAGLVFFGFLPFGAFVDIDEKVLFSEKKEKQNAVLVAGTAANFATSLVFLGVLMGFVALMGGVQEGVTPPGWAVYLARFLALTFALNTVVASVNLIPLPMFDGHHIMRNMVRNQHVATAITYIVGLSFLLTLFPWVLR